MEPPPLTSDSRHGNDHKFHRKEQTQKEDEKHLTPQLLTLVPEADPILHNRIEDMSLEDICNNETKQIVANMVYSIQPEQLKTANAPYNKAAGMAANQWNIRKRIFLLCSNSSDQEVKVIFNPSYKPIMHNPNLSNESKSTTTNQSTNLARESCFSVPHAYGIVERYTHIEISYVDDKGIEHSNEQLSDWSARVWQHETDHLNGILYSNRESGINHGPNCIELHRFKSKEELENNSTK